MCSQSQLHSEVWDVISHLNQQKIVSIHNSHSQTLVRLPGINNGIGKVNAVALQIYGDLLWCIIRMQHEKTAALFS